MDRVDDESELEDKSTFCCSSFPDCVGIEGAVSSSSEDECEDESEDESDDESNEDESEFNDTSFIFISSLLNFDESNVLTGSTVESEENSSTPSCI